MSDDDIQFARVAEELRALCSHISVRYDESIPFLLALGKRQTHTFDLRRKNGLLVLELWRGSSDNEVIISEEKYASFEEAYFQAEMWLRNDAA